MTSHGYVDPRTDCVQLARMIDAAWPAAGAAPSAEVLALADRAVERCPHEGRFWVTRAELRRLAGPARFSPRQITEDLDVAGRIDPDQWIHLAEYCRDELGDLDRAEHVYMQAIDAGAGMWLYIGLAELLAARGRVAAALAALHPAVCRFHDEPGVTAVRERLTGRGDEPAVTDAGGETR